MQIRDWLYVMDHCKAIDMVANGGKDGEVYNVGGHNERPNIFIVKTVIEQRNQLFGELIRTIVVGAASDVDGQFPEKNNCAITAAFHARSWVQWQSY